MTWQPGKRVRSHGEHPITGELEPGSAGHDHTGLLRDCSPCHPKDVLVTAVSVEQKDPSEPRRDGRSTQRSHQRQHGGRID